MAARAIAVLQLHIMLASDCVSFYLKEAAVSLSFTGVKNYSTEELAFRYLKLNIS